MTPQSKTLIAALQLAIIAMAIIALCVMAVSHTIDSQAIVGLFGVTLGHVGIISYNGATNTGQSPTITTQPGAHILGQRKSDAMQVIPNGPQAGPSTAPPSGTPTATGGPQAGS